MKRKSPARNKTGTPKKHGFADINHHTPVTRTRADKTKQRTKKKKASPAYQAKESMAYHGRVREAREKAGGVGKRSAMLRKKPPK